jgi:F0F1-type ATP synthase membrane subunit b/b'
MAMINNYIQECANRIQAQQRADIDKAKQKATQEKIVPFNAEIDNAKSKAIAELQAQLAAKIKSLQDEFEKQSNELVDAAEKKKHDFANQTLTMAENEVSVQYNRALADLAKIAEYTKG